jgi:hypothetical protein
MVWTSSWLRAGRSARSSPAAVAKNRQRGQWPRSLAALMLLTALAAGPAAAAPHRPSRAPGAPAAAYGFAELHPAWLQGSFWRGRPWPTGWYRTLPRAWARRGMAPVPALTATVNSALTQRQVWIAVPNTALLLNFGSVEVLPNSRIVFLYAGQASADGVDTNGGRTQRGVGECQIGLLNGRPVAGEQALLLHAACVVAFARGA